MKATVGERLFRGFNYLFLTVLSFTFLYPFWRIIILSVNDGIDSQKGGIFFLPRMLTLDNYAVIFAKPDIMSAYKITILRTVIGTVLSLIVCMLMAYGLSKKDLKGVRAVNIMMIITMYFSGGLIPTYLLYRDLSLLQSFWAYVIPVLYNAWNIILLRTFFRNLPSSLEESAKIDGANDMLVFFKIVFPLSLPIMATISLFTAVVHWNDWFAGTVYVTKRDMIPLQTLLMRIISDKQSSIGFIQASSGSLSSQQMQRVTSYSVKMATLVVTVLPIICVYPFLQKYFAKGVLAGSLKG